MTQDPLATPDPAATPEQLMDFAVRQLALKAVSISPAYLHPYIVDMAPLVAKLSKDQLHNLQGALQRHDDLAIYEALLDGMDLMETVEQVDQLTGSLQKYTLMRADARAANQRMAVSAIAKMLAVL